LEPSLGDIFSELDRHHWAVKGGPISVLRINVRKLKKVSTLTVPRCELDDGRGDDISYEDRRI